ncbi:DM13 domain-containing protein [Ornithinimicrobium sp. Arc0846-15]|nr:DM13 domain-containing protein [Ornithinimicrobium laminariae]
MRKSVIAVVAALAVAVGLWAFQPWRLFTSSEVDEALPVATSTASDLATAEADDAEMEDGDAATASPAEASPDLIELARGDFISQAHPTSGEAIILEAADGTRYLRFEGLASDDGPDLFVWLTDQPAEADDDVYDDGEYVNLGQLKATSGNQNYEIPADVDIDSLTSVSIWCDRFNVSFGAAPLA